AWREAVRRASGLERHLAHAAVAITPVRDVVGAVLEEHAVERGGDPRAVRLRVVRDGADDRVAPTDGDLDRRFVRARDDRVAVAADGLDRVVAELRPGRGGLAHRAAAGRDCDRSRRPAVPDGRGASADLAVDPQREAAGVALGDEPLRDRDRAAGTLLRVAARRRSVSRERPGEFGAVELGLEAVLDAARRERRRLATVSREGRERVLVARRLDRGVVLVLVAPVGEVLAAVELFDAFEEWDQLLGRRRRRRLAAVLVDRLP